MNYFIMKLLFHKKRYIFSVNGPKRMSLYYYFRIIFIN